MERDGGEPEGSRKYRGQDILHRRVYEVGRDKKSLVFRCRHKPLSDDRRMLYQYSEAGLKMFGEDVGEGAEPLPIIFL